MKLGRMEELQDILKKDNKRLKTDLDLHKHVSRVAAGGARWQYQHEGIWYAFPPDGNEQMLKAYLAYLCHPSRQNQHAQIDSGGVVRTVDFRHIQQTRRKTNRVRPIRIVLGVPEQWASPADSLLHQANHMRLRSLYVDVEECSLLDKVQDILRSTGHAWDINFDCSCMRRARVARVISLHRIENW